MASRCRCPPDSTPGTAAALSPMPSRSSRSRARVSAIRRLRPAIRRVRAGEALVRQGEPGREVFLLLDGAVRVERDGVRLAEYGPGALLGERAHLEGGARTSTVRAVTACRAAAVDAGKLDSAALAQLSAGHRREDAGRRS